MADLHLTTEDLEDIAWHATELGKRLGRAETKMVNCTCATGLTSHWPGCAKATPLTSMTVDDLACEASAQSYDGKGLQTAVQFFEDLNARTHNQD